MNDRPDTLAQWLYYRFIYGSEHEAKEWGGLPEEDRAFYEHEAAAVRRAVARGGFWMPGDPRDE